jgi:hypothetical protein
LIAGCTEISVETRKEQPEEVFPVLEITPTDVDFGLVTTGQVPFEVITVTNVGFTFLDVEEAILEASPGFSLTTPLSPPLSLDVQESWTFQVEFTPTEPGVATGTLTLLSDALNAEDGVVTLRADSAIPDLEVSPDPMDFGQRWVTCTTLDAFTISNAGNQPVVVEGVSVAGTTTDPLELQTPAFPLTLRDGSEFQVGVTFTPDARVDLDARFVVTTDHGDVEVPIVGEGIYPAEFTESFEVPEEEPVNLLFAVDQSGSMNDEAALLATEFSSFIGTLSAGTDDWKIGVVTLDSGCFNEGILTASTPNYSALFGTAVTIGDDGVQNTERLLNLVDIAIGRDGPGGCNDGFRDAGQPLHVIVVSDERDQSPDPWNTYYSRLLAYAGTPDLLTVHAIVDLNRSCGDNSGASGYFDIASQTNGRVLDICTPAWSSQLSSIAAAAVADLGLYALSRTNADPNSVAVSVDGVPWTSDWHWDDRRNGVVFDVDLQPGQQIEVSYGVLSTCF